MRSIKRSGTKLESQFECVLRAVCLADFERQVRSLPGTPDFVFRDLQVALFIDSCYWHACPEHLRMPATNQEYWAEKMRRNAERDARQATELAALGWRVARVWEHELKSEEVLKKRLSGVLATRAPQRSSQPRPQS